ncbi:MAG: transglutaminase-like domain-containing protein [Thermodesulfobacteriota bacterium]
MGQKNSIQPSWFYLIAYALRGTLALCRHLLKHRASYCVKRAETPSPVWRQYEPYRTDTRTSLKGYSLSREQYLRPTQHCNSHAPEIITLADHLRGGCKSDWDYACAVYNFVCNEILPMGVMPPTYGVVDTLQHGYGDCLDKTNLLIALARAGGIPARYCIIGSRFIALGSPEMVGRKVASIYDWVIDECFGFKAKTRERKDLAVLMQLGIEFQHFLSRHVHSIADLKIGGFWIPADPTFDKYLAAGINFPLQQLGYDPLMLWGLTGDVIARREEMSRKPHQWLRRRLFCAFSCGKNKCLNLHTDELRARGRQVLSEVGESEYMRSKHNYYVPVPGLAELGVNLTL